jgi:hypothetical protein
MVRLRRVRLGGKTTYVEVSPEACANGHPVLPGWGPCPDCRTMLRLWSCKVAGCDAPTLYDDEHACVSGGSTR